MSPRAASRLESIGFERVYDYVAGKADWGSAGLPLEGAEGSETRAGAHLRTDVPTCRPHDRMREVCERLDKSGWDTCFVVARTPNARSQPSRNLDDERGSSYLDGNGRAR